MALFRDLAELAEELAGEAGRLKKRAAIASVLLAVQRGDPEGEDAGLFAMYLAGMPFAEADSRKLNAGGALLTKALLVVSGASGGELTAAYRRHGDLGAAGFDLLTAAAGAGGEEGGRAAHDAHLSAMRPREDGAPGFVAWAESVAGLEPTHGDTTAMYGAPGFVAAAESAAGLKPTHGDTTAMYGAPGFVAGGEESGRAACPSQQAGWGPRAHDAHLSAMRPREDGAPGLVARAESAAGLKPTHGDTTAMYGAPGSVEGSESASSPGFGGGLTLVDVADAFAAMAVAKTTAVRAGLVEGLLRRAAPVEAKYLLKLMLGDMRIGVKQSLVEEAIAVGASELRSPHTSEPTSENPGPSASSGQAVGHPVSVAAVRRAVMLEADLAGAVRRAFAGTLGEARMRLFHPLGFMLASPVDTPEEAVERFAGKVAGVEDAAGNATTEADPCGMTTKKAKTTARARAKATAGPSTSAARVAPDDTVFEGLRDRTDKDGMQPVVEAFLEDKYDGMRAQVHCGDAGEPGRVAIYSRNREDVTESFPELEEAFARVRPEVDGALGGLIFDGEILGWDFGQSGQAGRALPFAVLGTRIGRKKVSNAMRAQVPVVFMAFDLMFAGGELLLELPLRERRNRLEAVVERLVERVVSPVMVDERARDAQAVLFAAAESAGSAAEVPVERLMISPSRLVESAEDIDRAYAEARARANEGVMLKAAGSVYQPGRRGLAWVKLKRELATLDVVITGAEFGHGKRAGLLSDYTFAVRGPDYAKTGELLNVGKAYSGVTDAEIAELTEFMKAHTLEDQGHFRTVEPLVVLEVAFNNIMRSGRHASGFALRFPRILRIRTDKPVGEIDTVERVEEVYLSQVDRPVEV